MTYPNMGLDPVSASLAVSVGQNLLSSLFSPAKPAGPSPGELAAAAAARAAAARDRNMMIAAGLVGAAVLVVVLLRSR